MPSLCQQRDELESEVSMLRTRTIKLEDNLRAAQKSNEELRASGRELRGRIDDLNRNGERDRLRATVSSLREAISIRDAKINELRRRASSTTLLEVAVGRDEALAECARLRGLLQAERRNRAHSAHGPGEGPTGTSFLLSGASLRADGGVLGATSDRTGSVLLGQREAYTKEHDQAVLVAELRDQIQWLRRQNLSLEMANARQADEFAVHKRNAESGTEAAAKKCNDAAAAPSPAADVATVAAAQTKEVSETWANRDYSKGEQSQLSAVGSDEAVVHRQTPKPSLKKSTKYKLPSQRDLGTQKRPV